MPTPEEHQRIAGELSKRVEKYAHMPAEEVTRPQLGELHFGGAGVSFDRLQATARFLQEASLDELPHPILLAGLGAFNQIEAPIQRIKDFSLGQSFRGSPIQEVQQLVQQFDQQTKQFFDAITPVVAFVVAQRISDQTGGPAAALRERLREAETLVAAVRARQTEIDDLLRVAREGVGEIGAAQHAIHFSEVAEDHKKAARGWLAATGVLGVLTALLTLVNYRHALGLTEPVAVSIALQIAVAKVLALSVALGATVWCGKIYRSHRHNFVVNRHRQNALSSFEAFASATDDATTKNAVLIQATQSIFAPQPSGYISGDDAPAHPQILELIRGVSESR